MALRTTAMLIALATVISGTACGGSMKEEARSFFETGMQEEFAEAVAEGRLERLDTLISRGVSVNSTGKAGMTFAYWAVFNRSRDGLTYLLSHGAEPNGIVDPKGIRRVPALPEVFEGTSPISLAAKFEDDWFLRYLAEHGADINLINPVSGRSPLVEALASNRRENVHYLISRGADLNTVDSIGFTPLAIAIGSEKFDIAYALLIAGADPTIPIARNGSTILTLLRHVPIPDPPQSEWRQKTVDLLEQKGLDVTKGG
jgi:ankyrin repeat protein